MPPLSIRTAQALSATQTIRSSQKHFVFRSFFANKHSQNDIVVKQPINHEYAHLYFAINQKTTAKTKYTRKIQYNQCHHEYHTSSDNTSQGAPTYPFLQIVIVCISAPLVPFWSCLHQRNTTRYKFFGFTKTV